MATYLSYFNSVKVVKSQELPLTSLIIQQDRLCFNKHMSDIHGAFSLTANIVIKSKCVDVHCIIKSLLNLSFVIPIESYHKYILYVLSIVKLNMLVIKIYIITLETGFG